MQCVGIFNRHLADESHGELKGKASCAPSRLPPFTGVEQRDIIKERLFMEDERRKAFYWMSPRVLSRGTGFTKVLIQLTPSRDPKNSGAGQFFEAGFLKIIN
jgi:hypothetical protein